MAPQPVAVAHARLHTPVEVACHLRRHDHSRAFWRLLDEARSGWREEHAWLDDHGHELQEYVPRLR